MTDSYQPIIGEQVQLREEWRSESKTGIFDADRNYVFTIVQTETALDSVSTGRRGETSDVWSLSSHWIEPVEVKEGQEVFVTFSLPGVIIQDNGPTVTVAIEDGSVRRTVPRHSVRAV